MLYSNVKLFFLTLAIMLYFSSTNAHGPSRQKVSESIEINALPDEVWKVVSNFKEFEWNNTVKNVKSSGNNIGSERVIEFKSGAFIKQKLEKIDDKKIKGISIQFDMSTKLNELDGAILDFEKKKDHKHEIDVSVDIQNATLHMKRVKKPYISLATVDGKVVRKIKEIDVKYKK